MRILWLSHVLPWPPNTGMLQRSHNLLKQVALRHEVHLFALNQGALLPDPEQVRRGQAELERICRRVVVRPIPSDRSSAARVWLLARSLVSRWPYDVNWLGSRDLTRDLEERSRSERFDVAHVDTIGMIPYTRWFSDTPVVLNHHNVESQLLVRRARRERNVAKGLYLHNEARKLLRLERNACPAVAVNLCVSRLDQERLREIVPSATFHVVDNGADVEYFRPRPATVPDGRALIFAGGMNWYPNREAALFLIREVWPALLARDRAWTLTIVGRNPPREVRDAARDPRIDVPGFVDDVRPYFDRAAICVCPIFDGGGTRLKVLDALAMAKPLVGTALAVEGLALGEERHYLRAETAREFAAQIERLAKDAELRARLTREGRELVVSRYSWDVIGAKLLAAYEAAAARPGHEPRRGAR